MAEEKKPRKPRARNHGAVMASINERLLMLDECGLPPESDVWRHIHRLQELLDELNRANGRSGDEEA